jgi:hypothetical protein
VADSVDRSVALIRALLEDPDLRLQFRRQPAETCRRHGLNELADQLAEQPRGMVTLELRESRSSLAGVVLAAAAEGVDFAHVAARAAPYVGREAAATLHQVVESLSPHKHPHAHNVEARPTVPGERSGIPSLKPGPSPPTGVPPAPANAPTVPQPASSSAPQNLIR